MYINHAAVHHETKTIHDQHSFCQYDANLYSGKAQPSTSRVIPVDAKNARDISLQQQQISLLLVFIKKIRKFSCLHLRSVISQYIRLFLNQLYQQVSSTCT